MHEVGPAGPGAVNVERSRPTPVPRGRAEDQAAWLEAGRPATWSALRKKPISSAS